MKKFNASVSKNSCILLKNPDREMVEAGDAAEQPETGVWGTCRERSYEVGGRRVGGL